MLERLPRNNLIEILRERGITVAPDAPREELQVLLRQSLQSSLPYRPGQQQQQQQQQQQRNTSKTSQQPLQDLLKNQLNIPYTSAATRSKQPTISSPLEPPTELPLDQLLAALDAQQIRYPPTATRLELQQLWQEHRQPRVDASPTKARQRPWKRVLSSQTLETKARRAFRKVKNVQQKARDYLATDEDGIRDVSFQYIDKDGPMDVPVIDVPYTTMEAPSNPRRRRRPPRPRQPVPNRPTRRPTRPPTSPSPTANLQYLLPPNNTATTTKRRTKAVYSQYRRDEDERDALDKFGDLVADNLDRIMWGRYDAEEAKNSTSRKKRRPASTDSRHWKDRLEERFDTVLGIKQDGKYYQSWNLKDLADLDPDEHFDVFDLVQGKRRRKPKRYHRAAWEEEGSLMSLLFGRTPSGGSLLYDKVLDARSGSLLNVFRAGAKSVLLVLGYACRWASVRGTIPQPVVVLGVATAGLSTRRNHLRSILVALVAIRIAGEVVHGYVMGDDDWDDDDDDEENEERTDEPSNDE